MPISLRTRLFFILIPSLGVFLVLGLAGMAALFHLGNEIDQILKENYDSVVAMNRLNEAIERIDSSFQLTLAGKESVGRTSFKDNWIQAERQFEIETKNITVYPEEPILVEKMREFLKIYKRKGENFFEVNQNRENKIQIYFGKEGDPGLLGVFGDIKKTIAAIHEINEGAMSVANESAKSIARFSFIGFLGGLAVAILASVVMVWWLWKTVLGPIQAMTEAANNIGKGQIHLSVPVFGKDELGLLAQEFNTMAAKLREYRQTNTENLLRAKKTNQATINSFADPVVVLDTQGQVVFANLAATALFGVATPEDGASRLVWQAPEPLRNCIDESLRRRRPFLTETFDQAVHFRQDGQDHTYLPQARPIFSPEGETLGIAILLHDVTRFRLLNRLKSDWVATVSHELKTPLTSVRLAIHVLLEEKVGSLEPKQVELLLEARDGTERLFQLIEQLLSLARLEEGEERLNYQPLDPMTIVRRAAERARSRAEDKRITLRVEEAFGLPKVNVDEYRMARALNNLLDNAIHFTPEGGTVTLSCQALEPGRVEIRVKDTGIGIPKEYVAKVFDRFFQVPQRDPGPGTGLGLAIVRETVLAHKGEIACESKLGEGTQFVLTLNAAESRA